MGISEHKGTASAHVAEVVRAVLLLGVFLVSLSLAGAPGSAEPRVVSRLTTAAEITAVQSPANAYAYVNYPVTLNVRNSGDETIGAADRPFFLTYRWFHGADPVSRLFVRRSLPVLAPSADVTLPVSFATGAGGTARVRWDLYRSDVGNLSDLGSPALDVTYTVGIDCRATYVVSGVPRYLFSRERRVLRITARNRGRMGWPRGRAITLRVSWTKRGGRASARRVTVPIRRYVAPGGLTRFRVATRAPRARGWHLLRVEFFNGAKSFARYGSAPYRRTIRVKRLSQAIYNHGNRSRREIALTFDDGFRVDWRILRITHRYRVPATAFLCGQAVAGNKRAIRWMKREGWEIANHSWSHPQLSRLSDGEITRQLARTGSALDRVVGRRFPFMRPPYGAVNSRVVRVANRMGYRVIIWDVDPIDWMSARSDERKLATILHQTRPGSIILMHFSGKGTARILPRVIRTLRRRGYRFKLLSDIIS